MTPRAPLPLPEKLRLALAPLHLVVGALLVGEGLRGAGPAALVLGGAFVAWGAYRLSRVRRVLK